MDQQGNDELLAKADLKKTVLITGASKGIGRALAEVFAKQGYVLLLVARDIGALQQLQQDLRTSYQCESKILSVDLARHDSIDRMMDHFASEMDTLDVLVNNAGLGYVNKFTDIPIEKNLQILNVNVMALTQLTHRVLPYMLRKKSGKILNVASTAAYLPGPFMAVYYASKAYVLSFSRALREEYKRDGIVVSALCPGPTKTEFQERAGMQKTLLVRGALPMMSAEKVAQKAYRGLMKGKATIVTGWMNHVNVFLAWLFPSGAAAKVVAVLQRPNK